MGISKEKLADLRARMESCGIREEDLIEKFILGSGKGGQKINKSSTCVYLKHLPSGMEIKCQRERSRELNRYYARRELCEKMETKIFLVESEKLKEIAKIRKQKKRRSRKVREKLFEQKQRRSAIKLSRRPPYNPVLK